MSRVFLVKVGRWVGKRCGYGRTDYFVQLLHSTNSAASIYEEYVVYRQQTCRPCFHPPAPPPPNGPALLAGLLGPLTQPRPRSSHGSVSQPNQSVKDNRGLDGALVPHRLQTLLPLIQLEGLVDNTLDLDLAAIEVVDRGGELVGLGEGAEDGDFVADCGVGEISTSAPSVRGWEG